MSFLSFLFLCVYDEEHVVCADNDNDNDKFSVAVVVSLWILFYDFFLRLLYVIMYVLGTVTPRLFKPRLTILLCTALPTQY